MRLAGFLKIGTLAETQARMSSREFARWLAFDRLEPIDSRFCEVAHEDIQITPEPSVPISQETMKARILGGLKAVPA